MCSGVSSTALAQIFVCKGACHATFAHGNIFVWLSLCVLKVRRKDYERTLFNNGPL